MANDAVIETVCGQEYPSAYRLVRKNGELILQGLFCETVTQRSRRDPSDLSLWAHYTRSEWRDVPTIEESGDGQ